MNRPDRLSVMNWSYQIYLSNSHELPPGPRKRTARGLTRAGDLPRMLSGSFDSAFVKLR